MDTNLVGNRIAQARKGANLSQAQLAQQLFISAQAVGKWERGESIPDIVTVSRLAEILGVDLNFFSDASVQAPVAAGASQGWGSADEAPAEPDHQEMGIEGHNMLTFSGSNLANSDFAGVKMHSRRFTGCALRGTDFSGADLTGSVFTGSDIRDANFSDANLTDCSLQANDLSGAIFNRPRLVRTEFSKAGLNNAVFCDARLIDVTLTRTDLRTTRFENCVLQGVDFKYSDLRGVSFEGQTISGVNFPNAALADVSFRDATLINVSFQSSFALTNKYYKAIRTILFDGARMDKLTYATLKGFGADLSGVTRM